MGRSFAAAALAVPGMGLLAAGFVASLYPNPWGFDGHSRLTCGSAFLFSLDGYSPNHSSCPARRTGMRMLSASLACAGLWCIVFGGWLLGRRPAPY
ncbi:hypothetical protein [Actinomadura rugatobispora]|uniref:Uncharacterized protein n=1 Tax=Actinomadura rugatobispora TaxID=1994 RepID=A0ABW0ZNP8_9ACTN|nr:hypothetical protein GCM10010200_043260 [Actinomadura rugatobispora]